MWRSIQDEWRRCFANLKSAPPLISALHPELESHFDTRVSRGLQFSNSMTFQTFPDQNTWFSRLFSSYFGKLILKSYKSWMSGVKNILQNSKILKFSSISCLAFTNPWVFLLPDLLKLCFFQTFHYFDHQFKKREETKKYFCNAQQMRLTVDERLTQKCRVEGHENV